MKWIGSSQGLLSLLLLGLAFGLVQAQFWDFDFDFSILPRSRSIAAIDRRYTRAVADPNGGPHPCDRECVEGEKPMECHYEFVIELYNSLSKVRYRSESWLGIIPTLPRPATTALWMVRIATDLIASLLMARREVLLSSTGLWLYLPLISIAKHDCYVHSRRMPGTPVVVCQGDRVIVDVHNHLHTETTSIHWHGSYFRLRTSFELKLMMFSFINS